MKSRKQLIIRYTLISIGIFVLSVVVAIFTRTILLRDGVLFSLTDSQASLVTSMIEGIVGALSAGIVVYQLRMGDNVEVHQNEIQESNFLFNYNQAFITNPEMTRIEMKLDAALESADEFEEENIEERQAVTNYLVYLEGLAPLLINKVISLPYADDLMAYRFFLAVNNDYIQQMHLFRYPQYYLGCFRVYRVWEDYRKEHNEDILISKTGKQLDDWVFFEHFTDDTVKVRCLGDKDCNTININSVARLLYHADPYIYPSAFGDNESYAARVITYLINNSISVFRKSNIYIAEYDGHVVGALILLKDDNISDIDTEALSSKFDKLPNTFEHAVNEHFNKSKNSLEKDALYICTLCVDPKVRRKHIAKKMIGELILDNIEKDFTLHVLKTNKTAIELYEKCGFVAEDKIIEGYSSDGPRPEVYKMYRKHQPEDILATNRTDKYNIFFNKQNDN